MRAISQPSPNISYPFLHFYSAFDIKVRSSVTVQLSFVNRAFPAVVVKIYDLSSVVGAGQGSCPCPGSGPSQLSKAIFVILVTSVANIPPAIQRDSPQPRQQSVSLKLQRSQLQSFIMYARWFASKYSLFNNFKWTKIDFFSFNH